MKTPLAIGALLASALIVQAGDVHDNAGTFTGQSTATMGQIEDGHIVMALTNTHEGFDMAAADHPFNGMSGNCTGSAIMRAPAVNGAGVCQYQTAAGDAFFVQYTIDSMLPDGAFAGDWSVIGGTGATKGASGGGRFVSLTDQETGKVTGTLTGAISMP